MGKEAIDCPRNIALRELMPDRSFAENRLIVHCHINRAESRCERGMAFLIGYSCEDAHDLRHVCRLRDSIDR